jgi:xanthine dehydrogenase accessory factor
MKEWAQIVQHIEENIEQSEKMALATVIQVEGSAYRRVGARMLVLENGNWLGSISGGCLEGDMLKKALLAMESQTYKIVTYDTREEDPFELGIGLGCNGKIDILINPFKPQILTFAQILKEALHAEKFTLIQSTWNFSDNLLSNVSAIPFVDDYIESSNLLIEKDFYQFTELISPQPRIWIVGNQFDSISLIQICLQLGWRIFWVGNTLKMKSSYKNQCENVFDWADELPIHSTDFIVFMTHDFDRDVEMTTKLYSSSPFAYWGILGPKKRMQKLVKQLNESGVQIEEDTISSPIGLDLGAEGPDEIAVSIVSEILAKINNRSAQPLKNRITPIHTN